MKRLAFALMLLVAPLAAAAQGNYATPESALDAPRPISVHETVWIHQMTWMEVRDAIASGTTTAIIAVGGTEENGPHVVNGKHFLLAQHDAEAIAKALGNALVAPVLPFNPGGDPERDFSAPSAGQPRPGTLSVRRETFKSAVTDFAYALMQSGFRDIVTIGDNGGDRVPLTEVAAEVNEQWAQDGIEARMTHIGEYYAVHTEVDEELGGWGIDQVMNSDGIHSSYRVEATLAAIDPVYARIADRVPAGRTTINGASILPVWRTIEHGERANRMKVLAAVQAIRKVQGARHADH